MKYLENCNFILVLLMERVKIEFKKGIGSPFGPMLTLWGSGHIDHHEWRRVLSPWAQLNTTFFVSNESQYFSHIIKKKNSFKIPILYSNSYSRKCTYIWCTYFDFLCFFFSITTSPPV